MTEDQALKELAAEPWGSDTEAPVEVQEIVNKRIERVKKEIQAGWTDNQRQARGECNTWLGWIGKKPEQRSFYAQEVFKLKNTLKVLEWVRDKGNRPETFPSGVDVRSFGKLKQHGFVVRESGYWSITDKGLERIEDIKRSIRLGFTGRTRNIDTAKRREKVLAAVMEQPCIYGNGISPAVLGSQVGKGYLKREGDNYYLTAKGKEFMERIASLD